MYECNVIAFIKFLCVNFDSKHLLYIIRVLFDQLDVINDNDKYQLRVKGDFVHVNNAMIVC